MDNFVYNIPTKVYFGKNQLGNLGKEVAYYGNKVLLCYGGGSIKKIGLYDNVMKELTESGMTVFELSGIDPNPRVDSVRKGAEICRKEGIDVVLAVGGGSTIDCAKFVCAATYYDGDAWDLLVKDLDIQKAVPLITILTLSATGSEMDNDGVISNPETDDKIGAAYDCMLPKVSFLDPTVTYSVSPYQTACGSADIMSHIIEEYFSLDNDLFMLDGVMETLMKTVIKYAPIAMECPDNYEARANLMWTSSWAINGFVHGGKTQAWSCHPMEHQLSAVYDITHGLGLAILTPRWMRYTLNEVTVDKYVQFAKNVFGIEESDDKFETAKNGIRALEKFFFEDLKLSRTLSEIGIDDSHFREMAVKASQPNAFQPLLPCDIEDIYRMCL